MMCLIHTLHIHPLKGALHNIRYGIKRSPHRDLHFAKAKLSVALTLL